MDIHEKLLTRFSLDDIVRPLFDHLLLVLWLSLFFLRTVKDGWYSMPSLLALHVHPVNCSFGVKGCYWRSV